MPPGLETLPAELFLRVLEQLTDKHDLSALSLVSKKWHGLVVQALWKSISIQPRSDYSPYRLIIAHLPRDRLQFLQKLHFRPKTEPEKCTHARDDRLPLWENELSEGESEIVDWDSTLDGSVYGLDERFRFLNLADRAVRVLDKLRDGQLSAFSWELGTCIPSQVLGPRGIVPCKHPLLRSLSLTTPQCHAPEAETREIDLSSFVELRSLRWIGPHPAHLRTLSAALGRNSARLQHLELYFDSWREFRNPLRHWTTGIDDELQRLCASRLFGLTAQFPQPILFPAISTLSLTGVPLTAAVAQALGFNTLWSLTIRECPGWREFLVWVVEAGLSVRLKAFEICDRDGQDPDSGL
ncbi:hypothetical protein C8A05DRAFT_19723, partial [Staphylotrichum tortipilum]